MNIPYPQGQQHQADDITSVMAAVDVKANRFISYGGGYATSAGGSGDSQGIGQMDTPAGSAIPVVTEYSYLLECSEAIAKDAYVKPADDGTGRGATGTLTDHCGRALGSSTAAGQLLEVQIVRHVHG